MVVSVDLAQLESSVRTAAAEVRLVHVQGEDAKLAGHHVTAYLEGLAKSRDGFRRIAAEISDGTARICEADQFFSDEEVESIRRIEAFFRDWAPRFAALRAPEDSAMSLAFPSWFRSYNDALTTLVRKLLDCAAALHERLAEEAAEDAEADAWAGRALPLPEDEELVPRPGAGSR